MKNNFLLVLSLGFSRLVLAQASCQSAVEQCEYENSKEEEGVCFMTTGASDFESPSMMMFRSGDRKRFSEDTERNTIFDYDRNSRNNDQHKNMNYDSAAVAPRGNLAGGIGEGSSSSGIDQPLASYRFNILNAPVRRLMGTSRLGGSPRSSFLKGAMIVGGWMVGERNVPLMAAVRNYSSSFVRPVVVTPFFAPITSWPDRTLLSKRLLTTSKSDGISTSEEPTLKQSAAMIAEAVEEKNPFEINEKVAAEAYTRAEQAEQVALAAFERADDAFFCMDREAWEKAMEETSVAVKACSQAADVYQEAMGRDHEIFQDEWGYGIEVRAKVMEGRLLSTKVVYGLALKRNANKIIAAKDIACEEGVSGAVEANKKVCSLEPFVIIAIQDEKTAIDTLLKANEASCEKDKFYDDAINAVHEAAWAYRQLGWAIERLSNETPDTTKIKCEWSKRLQFAKERDNYFTRSLELLRAKRDGAMADVAIEKARNASDEELEKAWDEALKAADEAKKTYSTAAYVYQNLINIARDQDKEKAKTDWEGPLKLSKERENYWIGYFSVIKASKAAKMAKAARDSAEQTPIKVDEEAWGAAFEAIRTTEDAYAHASDTYQKILENVTEEDKDFRDFLKRQLNYINSQKNVWAADFFTTQCLRAEKIVTDVFSKYAATTAEDVATIKESARTVEEAISQAIAIYQKIIEEADEKEEHIEDLKRLESKKAYWADLLIKVNNYTLSPH